MHTVLRRSTRLRIDKPTRHPNRYFEENHGDRFCENSDAAS